MQASKEDVCHALENLKTQERFMNEYAFKIILGVLEACEKRVPTQAAIDRDKQRKRVKAK